LEDAALTWRLGGGNVQPQSTIQGQETKAKLIQGQDTKKTSMQGQDTQKNDSGTRDQHDTLISFRRITESLSLFMLW